MKQAVIIDGIRTPIGKLNGAMKDIEPEIMASLLISEMVKRTNLNPQELDSIILGHTKQSADQPNIARLAALMAGIPVEVQSYTIHRQCGSACRQCITWHRKSCVVYPDSALPAAWKAEQRPILSAQGAQGLLGRQRRDS
jgi:acetyl-CoA acetyltransferase